MAEGTLTDERLVAVLQDYLALLQRHAGAEEMLERVVTADFEAGYVSGQRWSGEEGLREYLAQREGFFDERHVIEGLVKREDRDDGEIEAHTSLHFFMRRWEAPSPKSEEFTGRCFHVWRLRRDGFDWRVASQLVERFADLNPNAERAFVASR